MAAGKEQLPLLEQTLDDERAHAIMEALQTSSQTAGYRLLVREITIEMGRTQDEVMTMPPDSHRLAFKQGLYAGLKWVLEHPGNVVEQMLEHLNAKPTEPD